MIKFIGYKLECRQCNSYYCQVDANSTKVGDSSVEMKKDKPHRLKSMLLSIENKKDKSEMRASFYATLIPTRNTVLE